MGVRADPVVPLAAVLVWVDMNVHASEVRDVMEQLMPHLAGNVMAFGDGETTRHCHAEVGVQPMANPTRSNVGNFLDTRDMAGGGEDVCQRLRFHAIQHAKKHRPRRLPDDESSTTCAAPPSAASFPARHGAAAD